MTGFVSQCLEQYIKTLNSVVGDLRHHLPYNMQKYGLMQYDEKFLLVQLSRSLQPNSVIVEVGSFLGSSAAIMSNANPTVDLHCFDPFEDSEPRQVDGSSIIASALGPDTPRSLSAVQALLKDFERIQLHQGYSPWSFMEWSTPIDLYFEDGLHHDPEFSANIDFWSSHLKIGGLLVIHDHRPWLKEGDYLHFPAVIDRVRALQSDSSWRYLGQVYTTAVFEKLDASNDLALRRRAYEAFVDYQRNKLRG